MPVYGAGKASSCPGFGVRRGLSPDGLREINAIVGQRDYAVIEELFFPSTIAKTLSFAVI